MSAAVGLAPACSANTMQVPLSAGDASEQSSEASSAAEDGDQESQPSDEQDDSAAGRLWRAHIRRTDAADDPRWRLEIGILSSERNGQQVLEVRRQPAVISARINDIDHMTLQSKTHPSE